MENLIDLDQILHDQGVEEEYMKSNAYISSVTHNDKCLHSQDTIRSNKIDEFRSNEKHLCSHHHAQNSNDTNNSLLERVILETDENEKE